MTSVWNRGHLRWEHLSVTLFDSSLPPGSDDKLSKQPIRPSGTKLPIAIALDAAINIPKYSENDLQRFLKTVLEA